MDCTLVRLALADVDADNKDVGVFIRLPPGLAADWPCEGRAGKDDSPPHITVLYIGEVADEDVGTILDAVEEIVQDTQSFEVSLAEGVDWFTDDESQEIAHKSVHGDSLHELHDRLREALEEAGVDVEVRDDYVPHATLAYLPDRSYPDEWPIPEGSFDVSTVEVWGRDWPAAHVFALSDSSSRRCTARGEKPKRTVTWHGLDLAVEYEPGDLRGEEWGDPTVVPYEYGYIVGTEAEDGDSVDFILGPDPGASNVYVAAQKDDGGEFCQFKALLDFTDEASAEAAFKLLWSADKFAGIAAIPVEEFVAYTLPGRLDVAAARPERARPLRRHNVPRWIAPGVPVPESPQEVVEYEDPEEVGRAGRWDLADPWLLAEQYPTAPWGMAFFDWLYTPDGQEWLAGVDGDFFQRRLGFDPDTDPELPAPREPSTGAWSRCDECDAIGAINHRCWACGEWPHKGTFPEYSRRVRVGGIRPTTVQLQAVRVRKNATNVRWRSGCRDGEMRLDVVRPGDHVEFTEAVTEDDVEVRAGAHGVVVETEPGGPTVLVKVPALRRDPLRAGVVLLWAHPADIAVLVNDRDDRVAC